MRLVGGDLALDFVNTRSGPPVGRPDDDVLVGYAELVVLGCLRGRPHGGRIREAASPREQGPRRRRRGVRALAEDAATTSTRSSGRWRVADARMHVH